MLYVFAGTCASLSHKYHAHMYTVSGLCAHGTRIIPNEMIDSTGMRVRVREQQQQDDGSKSICGGGDESTNNSEKVWKLSWWLMVHAFCGTEGNSHRLCHCAQE